MKKLDFSLSTSTYLSEKSTNFDFAPDVPPLWYHLECSHGKIANDAQVDRPESEGGCALCQVGTHQGTTHTQQEDHEIVPTQAIPEVE